MARRLKFDRVATIEDSGDPVIHARLPDTGSCAYVILDTEDRIIRVDKIESFHRGDMALMMDVMVEQLGWRHVRFMNPISETLPGANLEDRLEGFDRIREPVEGQAKRALPGLDYIVVLDGYWNPDRDREGVATRED